MADTGHDGSLQFDTGMDTSGFEAGSDKLLQSIQTLIDTVKTMGDSMQRSFSEMAPVLQNLASTTGQIYAAMSSGAQQAAQQQQAATAATQQQAQATQQAAEAAEAYKAKTSDLFKAPQKDARQLESTMDKLDATVEKGFTSGTGVLKFVNDLQKAGVQVDTLRNELDAISSQTVKTEQYERLEKSFEAAVAQADKLHQKQRELDKQGVRHNSSRYLTLEKQMEAAEAKADDFRTMLESIEARGEAFTTVSNTAEWQQMNALLQEAEAKLAQHRDLIGAEEIEQAKLNARIAETNYLQNRGTEEEAAALQRLIEARTKLNKLAAQVAGKKNSSTANEVKTVKELQTRLEDLKRKRQELESAGGTESEEYRQVCNEIKDINSQLAQTSPRIAQITDQLAQWEDELKDLQARGFGPGYAEYDKLTAKIKAATAAVKEYGAVKSGLSTEGIQASLISGGGSLSQLAMLAGPEAAAVVAVVEKTLSIVVKAVTVAASIIVGAVKKVASVVGAIGSATASAVAAYAQAAATAVQKLGAAAASAAAGLIKLQVSGLKLTFQTIAKGAKSLVDKIKELATRAKKATPNVNALAKALTSFKRMIISRFKRMFITYVVTEIKNAFSALVKFSNDFDQTISGIRNTTSELAGNIAASLEGLINTIGPIIQNFISGLSTAVTYLSALFGMLAGKKTITVAKKQTASYADSLRDTADAAEEAEGSLASFDTLTTIDDGSDKSGAAAAADDGSDRFEEVPIDSILPEDVKDWFGKLKVAFEAQDWEGIGDLLADKINELIDKLKKLLDGDELKKKLRALADALADLLNGLFKGVHWRDLGNVLAEGLNLLLDALNEFLKRLDTGAWGRAAADLINGFIEKFDWSLMGETLGNFCNRIIDFFWEFLTGTNWVLLGAGFATALNTFLHTVEWEKLGMTVGAGLNAIVNTINGFVQNTEWETLGGALAAAVTGCFNQINWGTIGSTFATGLNGIVDAIDTFVALTDWTVLGQGLADMLIKAIEGTDFADIGRTLGHTINAAITTYDTFEAEMGPWFRVLGEKLADGINTAIINIDWAGIGRMLSGRFITDALDGFVSNLNYSGIGESVATTVDSWFTNVDWAGITTTLTNGVNGVFDAIDSFVNGTHWDVYGTTIATQINNFFSGVDWPGIGTTLKDSCNAVISAAFNFVDNVQWANIGTDFATTVETWLTGINWDELAQTLAGLVSGLADVITNFAENVNWEQIGTDIGDAFREINWDEIWQKLSGAIGTAFGSIGSFLSGLFAGGTDEAEQWWKDHAFEDGEFSLQKFWDSLSESLGDIASWVSENIVTPFIAALLTSFGLDVSEANNLAEMGGKVMESFMDGMIDQLDRLEEWVEDSIFWPIIVAIEKAFGIDSAPDQQKAYEDGVSITDGLLRGINGGLGTSLAAETIAGIFKWVVDSIKKKFGIGSPAKEMEPYGEYISEGLLNGTSGPFETIQNWLDEHIFTPFVTAIKSLFGIRSPSTEMKEIGGYISDGLLNGVKNPFSSIRTWINTNVFTPFINGFKSLFGISSPSTVMQTQGGYIVDGLKNGVNNNWGGFSSTLTTKFNNLKSQLQNVNWQTVGSNIISGLKNGISAGWNLVTGAVTTVGNKIIGAANAVFNSGSPSRVFEEIGGFVDEGLAIGIAGGEHGVLSTVKNLAENVNAQGEDIAPDLTFNGGALINGLTTVSDKLSNIATSLANITSYLDRVGGLQIPAIAAGTVIPYKARAADGGAETEAATQSAATQALLREILQALTGLENKEITATTPDIYIDGVRVTRSVVNNANRMTVAAGKSVFIV